MKAIALQHYGDADALEIIEQSTPAVAPGEFLVRVKAAGVNPADEKIAVGNLDGIMVTHFPLIPGFEMAGVIEARGFGATEFEIGDEVIGFVLKDWAQNGAYAELVSAPVRTLARKPASWDWLRSACLPLNGLTAYQAIKRISIGEGDTVLIHGAAGGVGSLAVQIAAIRGAHVIGTASERNHGYLRELGATPITYGEGLADRVRELAPEGVDAALDFYGGDAVAVSQKVLKDPARVASVADITAPEQGGQLVWARASADELTEVAALAESGKLSVPVNRSFPLEQAADAWRMLHADSRARGRVVLDIDAT
ncbi:MULTISPECIES: NADP-dependent oxidoreductase [unclassified Streptomyces]|uniref:NADP-dependent oxidoreductase n=1 Tax=unclassified Streptomyces TaxID=2593676 RepID=UPI002DDB08D8|nr:MULTISPECIES: NADP-dependent oxidoreductase [unclassified Streptomyces]WSA95858.1 NADP-dependent oxidoreductase [Streptomyces sp. NBC_01795]WSB80275.1 NADP-dependent oxidoreductase [Streptomyces sp. NBC_01775]WSS11515.1 NADP-dependent oxidoreductase [Streptomyces sp. NBC_01186]WSS40230.1 NADP-dependent oxidoreductase [Streptomyces sp. NBC_01187]